MINIINNILSNNGYRRVDIEIPLDNQTFNLFCPCDEIKREEYFVTIQLSTQSDTTAQTVLDKTAQELFEAICNSGKVEQSFEKNCTMFICHEEEKITRKKILSLEEDPYNFKKNVITYTPDELTDLESYLSQNKIIKITIDSINNIITSESGRNFLAFKEDYLNSRGYYSLILKIALKLPFITYIPQEKKLINLNSEIESALNPHQSLIYNLLLGVDVEWNEENIHQQVDFIWGKSL